VAGRVRGATLRCQPHPVQVGSVAGKMPNYGWLLAPGPGLRRSQVRGGSRQRGGSGKPMLGAPASSRQVRRVGHQPDTERPTPLPDPPVQVGSVAGKLPNFGWLLAQKPRVRRSQARGAKPTTWWSWQAEAGSAGFQPAGGAGGGADRDTGCPGCCRARPCKAVRWPARCLTEAASSRGGLVCGAPSSKTIAGRGKQKE